MGESATDNDGGRSIKRTEGKLFERAVGRFGEEEPDKDDLKQKENAVADVVFPAYAVARQLILGTIAGHERTGVVDANRVYELVEEASSTAPPLEDGNAFGTCVEREELDEIRCTRMSA